MTAAVEFKGQTSDGKSKRGAVPTGKTMAASVHAPHAITKISRTNDSLVPLFKPRDLPKAIVPPKAADAAARIRQLVSARKIIVVAALVIVATIGYAAAGSFVAQQNRAKNSSGIAYKTKTYQNPDFRTVLPAGKSVGQFGGWKRISPPGSAPVFAYIDKIDDVEISVSEQPLPAAFVTDTSGQIASLAEKFNATDTFDAGGTPVYVGTSAKGPQSVIFAKGNLLMLIKSASKIADKSWSAYVRSLG